MIDQWITQNANDLQVALFFILFFVFGLAELLAPKRPGPMQRKERWLANLILTALNIAVMGLLPVTFFGAAVWAQEKGIGLFNQLAMPMLLLVTGNLLARGFISFLTHYLMHKVPWFWRLHRVHHLDTELDVSTTVRFHPLACAVGLLLGGPLVLAFGLTLWVLLLYELLDAMVTLFSHANVRLPMAVDRVLRFIVVTPDLHRIHHSSWQPETDSNFGAVFPIWDIVFGTFRAQTRAPQETMELGIEEVRDGRSNRILWLLASPLLQMKQKDAKTAARQPGQTMSQPNLK